MAPPRRRRLAASGATVLVGGGGSTTAGSRSDTASYHPAKKTRFNAVFVRFGVGVSDFEAIRGYLQRVDRWHDGFEPLVRELLELREARTAALARARQAPTVAGSQGQERETPGWGTALKLQASIDRLSGMLLLTPRSAVRAGVRLPADNPFDEFAELDGGWSDPEDPFAELAARRRG